MHQIQVMRETVSKHTGWSGQQFLQLRMVETLLEHTARVSSQLLHLSSVVLSSSCMMFLMMLRKLVGLFRMYTTWWSIACSDQIVSCAELSADNDPCTILQLPTSHVFLRASQRSSQKTLNLNFLCKQRDWSVDAFVCLMDFGVVWGRTLWFFRVCSRSPTMQSFVLALVLRACLSSGVALDVRSHMQQDPCAGCNEELAQGYQVCVKDFGNPCAETNEAGLLVEGEGAKKDVPCCLKKEKHQQCLKCKTMDCSYETCSPHLNKNYYSFWDSPKADPDFAKKGMQAAGWGNWVCHTGHFFGEIDHQSVRQVQSQTTFEKQDECYDVVHISLDFRTLDRFWRRVCSPASMSRTSVCLSGRFTWHSLNPLHHGSVFSFLKLWTDTKRLPKQQTDQSTLRPTTRAHSTNWDT